MFFHTTSLEDEEGAEPAQPAEPQSLLDRWVPNLLWREPVKTPEEERARKKGKVIEKYLEGE